MKCPNNNCKRTIDVDKNSDSNFDYCKECGTVIHRNKKKQ